jgi:transcriptional regulator with XRE-family HTH domain
LGLKNPAELASKIDEVRRRRHFARDDGEGFSSETVRSWEKKKRWPQPEQFADLAKALEVEPWQLLKDPDKPVSVAPPPTLDLAGLLGLLPLAPDLREELLRTLRGYERASGSSRESHKTRK